MPSTVLIIEDDPSLALGLSDALEFEGFSVLHGKSGQEGMKLFRDRNPDCIILDVMLPDTNGYRICEQIRAQKSHTPIIMLTARSQEIDKIRGLDSGADDYVTKPFSVGELTARVRAIFRRTQKIQAPETFVMGEATINPANQTVTVHNNSEALTFYELSLLKLFYNNPGVPLTRDEILHKVWGTSAANHRTVDNCIVKLRKKIEMVPDDPTHIVTVHGQGYKYAG